MPYGTDLVLIYDGTFEGLMSCVFEVYSKKLNVLEVFTEESFTPTLYESYEIVTDLEHARRVVNGLRDKVSPDALYLAANCFLTDEPQKELLIIDFIKLAFKEGRKTPYMLGNDTVRTVTNAVKRMNGEAHHYKGFVRFTDCGEALVSVIEPRCFVLPLLAEHFCDRFHNEALMIFDKTHKAALLYKDGISKIVELDALPAAFMNSEEMDYQRLWKGYCEAIAIPERRNPRCQMTLMPKRFWNHMIEMQEKNDLLSSPYRLEN